jgi:hypothetical protein
MSAREEEKKRGWVLKREEWEGNRVTVEGLENIQA